MGSISQFVSSEEGADLIEYALLAGFISLAAVTVISLIGTNLNTVYTKVNSQVKSAAK